jgi:L-ascorbate metabolism protein UlaG (beta-lactamase superfamily)
VAVHRSQWPAPDRDPGQHFSGRGLGDSDRSLWASWVIQDGDFRIFFSGDTGYFDGFKAIGEVRTVRPDHDRDRCL